MDSLLARVTKADVLVDPFPHVVIHQPYPDEIADQLLADYPPVAKVVGDEPYAQNKAYYYTACQVLADDAMSPLWKAFMAHHASAAFLTEVYELFEDHWPPNVRTMLTGADKMSVGMRGVDTYAESDILIDAQIGINTPVEVQPSSVRGPHVDRSCAFFGGLYYLRYPGDDSTGGDLEIYRPKGELKGRFNGQKMAPKDVDVAKTVRYRHNTLVLFMNSVRSLHGVTPRSVTTWPRLLVNLVAEAEDPWYDLDAYQWRDEPKGVLQRLRERVGR